MPAQTSNKPVLAVDFDDTLVYNAQRVVEAYNREHSAQVTLNDVYVAEKYGNPVHGWHHNRAEAREWIRNYLISKEGIDNPPLPGTKAVLAHLRQHYNLVVVTGRRPNWKSGTDAWLERFMPGFFSAVYHAGHTPKSEVCAEIGANIIIDDSPHYLSFCVEAGMQTILFGDYPWNQMETLPPGMQRAKNWAEVEEILLG